jgi:hypothetical protein
MTLNWRTDKARDEFVDGELDSVSFRVREDDVEKEGEKAHRLVPEMLPNKYDSDEKDSPELVAERRRWRRTLQLATETDSSREVAEKMQLLT